MTASVNGSTGGLSDGDGLRGDRRLPDGLHRGDTLRSGDAGPSDGRGAAPLLRSAPGHAPLAGQSELTGQAPIAAGLPAVGIAPRHRLRLEPVAPDREPDSEPLPPAVFEIRDMAVHYGPALALAQTTLDIHANTVTAVIGPSGCGKSTFLRSLNRMNDSIPGFRLSGQVLYRGHDLYAPATSRVEVRRRIGMVFQKPNPFPKSIYDNVAWAPRNLGMRAGLDDRVRHALEQAALWDEVKDRLRESALRLSGGQQQRLCIARAIAIEPDVLLLDEPASALDPLATASIEELIRVLRHRFTIVIVTHNMQQAARVADRTAFFGLEAVGGRRAGTLIEYAPTRTLFTNPADPRTRDYVSGRFG